MMQKVCSSSAKYSMSALLFFQSNEYCIYSTDRQTLRYIIEYVEDSEVSILKPVVFPELMETQDSNIESDTVENSRTKKPSNFKLMGK